MIWDISAKTSTWLRTQYGMGARFAFDTLLLHWRTMREEIE